MKKFEHGGNVWKLARQLGMSPPEVVDLSTCVADEIPPEIQDILKETGYHRILPEPYASFFSKQYALHKGIPENTVLLTAGTTEAIYALCRIFRGRNVAIFTPTYMDYERAALTEDMNIQFIPADPQDFSFSLRRLNEVDLCFICNPNNPTGTLWKDDTLDTMVRQNPGTLFVVDESYLPFVEEGNRRTAFLKYDNSVTLRSYSKVFGIPGMRIGYVAGAAGVIEEIKKHISPWSVTTLGQQTALRLMGMEQTPVGGLELNRRKELESFLKSTGYIKPYSSHTHFFLCGLEGVCSEELAARCAARGILIRDCSNIRGLGRDFVRISTRHGWEKLKEVL